MIMRLGLGTICNEQAEKLNNLKNLLKKSIATLKLILSKAQFQKITEDLGQGYSGANFKNCEKVLYKHLNDTVTQCAETFDLMIERYVDCYHLEVNHR